MPTFLKLIIMLAEVIGFCIFSFIRCRKQYKIYKEDKEDEVQKSNLKVSIIYYSICVSIVLFIFIFTFPAYVFLSYNKLILITVAIIASIIPCILLSKIDFFDHHEVIGGTVIALFIVLLGYTFAITIVSFFAYEQCIQFKECISEEKDTKIIYPVMNLTDNSKIGYTEDSNGNIDSYRFFYQDDFGNWCEVNGFIENAEELSNDESSYVEKYVTTRTILNYEFNESDDNYRTTEEIITYIVHYNPNELIKIT